MKTFIANTPKQPIPPIERQTIITREVWASPSKLPKLIALVEEHPNFTRHYYVPITEGNVVESFNYNYTETPNASDPYIVRATISFDTKTHKLSFTSKYSVVKLLQDMYGTFKNDKLEQKKAVEEKVENNATAPKLQFATSLKQTALKTKPIDSVAKNTSNNRFLNKDTAENTQEQPVRKLKISDKLKDKLAHIKTGTNIDVATKQQIKEKPASKPATAPTLQRNKYQIEALKKLKKLAPHAYDYLSEQCKTDLANSLLDIFNDRLRLSDYSVLLVPPYRALERLIFDLQALKGITTKMIGQAFEKNDKGEYLLKSGYIKKINSIVYNEVLSALYTEYFFQRHAVTHSDNSDDDNSRGVKSILGTQNIFKNLLQLIDYNCKKLQEIGLNPIDN